MIGRPLEGRGQSEILGHKRKFHTPYASTPSQHGNPTRDPSHSRQRALASATSSPKAAKYQSPDARPAISSNWTVSTTRISKSSALATVGSGPLYETSRDEIFPRCILSRSTHSTVSPVAGTRANPLKLLISSAPTCFPSCAETKTCVIFIKPPAADRVDTGARRSVSSTTPTINEFDGRSLSGWMIGDRRLDTTRFEL
jgi:hypothetical protein